MSFSCSLRASLVRYYGAPTHRNRFLPVSTDEQYRRQERQRVRAATPNGRRVATLTPASALRHEVTEGAIPPRYRAPETVELRARSRVALCPRRRPPHLRLSGRRRPPERQGLAPSRQPLARGANGQPRTPRRQLPRRPQGARSRPTSPMAGRAALRRSQARVGCGTPALPAAMRACELHMVLSHPATGRTPRWARSQTADLALPCARRQRTRP